MKYRALFVLPLVAAACAAPAGAREDDQAFVPLRAQNLANLSARLLTAHNAERRRVGVPALRWDPALARSAAAYGPTLSRIGRLQHSTRAARPGQSENLWMGSRGAYSPEQMVGSWASERAYFRPGIFPNVSRTGNWADVGHYTQLIWRSTSHVGCALHRDRRWDFLICRYSPKGNIDGRRVP